MDAEIAEFTVMGSPGTISRSLEQWVGGRGSLSAIVVPWESSALTVSMAVTSARGEGWAIEHSNLGTIRLTDIGNDETRVVILAHENEGPDKEKQSAFFQGFAQQVKGKFQKAP